MPTFCQEMVASWKVLINPLSARSCKIRSMAASAHRIPVLRCAFTEHAKVGGKTLKRVRLLNSCSQLEGHFHISSEENCAVIKHYSYLKNHHYSLFQSERQTGLSWTGMAEMPIWFLGLRPRAGSPFHRLPRRSKMSNTAGVFARS